jgi:hypothetical protein
VNTARLLELVERLLAVETGTAMSKTLARLTAAMQAIVDQPNQAEAQNQFSEQFNELNVKVAEMLAAFSPAEVELMGEIGARPHFATNLFDEISTSIQQNAVTPAVVVTTISTIRDERNAYIGVLKALQQSLVTLGIKASTLQAGEAELSILLPRSLFDNRFDELIDELGEIDKIFRIFSEIATGHVEPVKVRQISTTDPVFGFGMAVATIGLIGKSITWALDTWERVEKIRKLRRDAQGTFTPEEIEQIFEARIKKTIEEQVTVRVAELLNVGKEDVGRKQELRNGLEWALNSILYRIERGMTVEVRFLPPAAPSEGGSPIEEATVANFTVLSEVAPQMRFPPPQPDPILQLPAPPPPPIQKN